MKYKNLVNIRKWNGEDAFWLDKDTGIKYVWFIDEIPNPEQLKDIDDYAKNKKVKNEQNS